MRDVPVARLVLTPVVLLGLAAFARSQTSFYTWTGNGFNDDFGVCVRGAGDVNDDGWPDVIVGALQDLSYSTSGAGSAYVYSGKDGSLIWAVHGTQVGEHFGYSVAGVGDLDHDGFADFAVGAPNWDNAVMVPDVGAVHVFSGKTGAKFFTFDGTETNDQYGASVAGCGDWNGDGTPDIVVGAWGYTNVVGSTPHPGSGRAIVISGTTPSSIIQSFNGVEDGESFGFAVASAGDFDGDGFEDIVVGSPGSTTSGAAGGIGGKARVYSGQFKSLLITKQGPNFAALGWAVDGVGDANDDGKDDFVVGAPGDYSSSGTVRVYKGGGGGLLQGEIGDAVGDVLGGAVCGVGDADKDGFTDFAGGTYPNVSPGYARAWSGSTGKVLYDTISSPAGALMFGSSIDGPGDLDQDGWPDLLVGDMYYNAAAGGNAGGAFAYDLVIHQPNLGFGGPGTAFMEMHGAPLATGGVADLHLSGAKPNALSWLAASVGQAFASFKGGVLVPDLALGLVFPMVTNAQGKLDLPSIPGGLGPYSISLQAIIMDGSQPHGFALSNAVQANFAP